MDQYIGKLLDNRYEILEVVGTGGMARVYKARCHRLNRLVAVKILREDLSQDAELRRRFHDESQAVAMLSHPNIVAVYDVSRSSGLEYIVMELIDGISLKQYMQKKGNKLNWREALHFITQITKALGHAHSRGIIHRDIKPHNVMVLRDGSVKVADFGIARLMSGGHSTLTQEALGSVHYISPEQARGSHIDSRSDLYSAGVVLYEMITGRLPFEGDTPVSVAIQHINSIPLTPREIDPTIPEALEAITMKAMAPNPDKRYSSADEMLADLEEFRKNPNINFDYNITDFSPEEEPDEDKTMIRSVQNRESRNQSAASRGQNREKKRQREYDEDDEPRRNSVLPILVAVAAIFLFIGGVFFFLYRTVFSGFFAPAETFKVPDLIGKSYEEVVDNQALLGRFTVTLAETVSDDADPGTILDQSPEKNTTVAAGVTEIKLTVSGGPELCYVPDIYNMEYREAYLAIKNAGLVPEQYPTYEFHDEILANHVISFTPPMDIPLAPGTEVQIVISKGPEIKEYPMFNLIGMNQINAENQIVLNNLQIGTITPAFSSTVEAGVVMDQYPAAETIIKEGDKVNLIVSQGPDPSIPIIEDITKTVQIPLPTSGDVVNLVLMMDGDVIWESEYDTAMEAFAELPITAPAGTVKDITYFWDGVMSGTVSVSFTADAPIVGE